MKKSGKQFTIQTRCSCWSYRISNFYNFFLFQRAVLRFLYTRNHRVVFRSHWPHTREVHILARKESLQWPSLPITRKELENNHWSSSRLTLLTFNKQLFLVIESSWLYCGEPRPSVCFTYPVLWRIPLGWWVSARIRQYSWQGGCHQGCSFPLLELISAAFIKQNGSALTR